MDTYEKKYKEIVGKIRKAYLYAQTDSTKAVLKEIFPELKESEDEKIRKEIIQFIRMEVEDEIVGNKWLAWLGKQGERKTPQWMIDFLDDYRRKIGCSLDHDEARDVEGKILCIIQWLENKGEQEKDILEDAIFDGYILDGNEDGLIAETIRYKYEKQAEQNPTDKIEPKFKVGDYIKHNKASTICKIISVNNGSYYVENIETNCKIELFWAEENFHLWTIQDAKDGDILHSTGFYSDCVFIFNGLDNWKFEEPNGDRIVATAHCCITISADNIEFGIQGPDCIEVNRIKPATKEQRDLLFKTMEEIGYEWDAEKKELSHYIA